jgi:TonB family protein
VYVASFSVSVRHVLFVWLAVGIAGVPVYAQATERVQIKTETLIAWDPALHARVIEDMADGVPSVGFRPPARTRGVLPRYPDAAKKAGIEGVVTVTARVGVNGKIVKITGEGDEQLLRAVREALLQWRFRPLQIDGRPREMLLEVEFAFALR